jgi:hypothetical protein
MLTESSQTRVAGCLLELHKAGWVITFPELATDQPPPVITARYADIPRDFRLFLGMCGSCANPKNNAWLFTNAIYYGNESFEYEWDVCEKTSLASLGENESDAAVRDFWNRHLPIGLAVHSDYAFLAIVIKGEHAGSVVYGSGPNFEATPLVLAESFTDFLGMLARYAKANPEESGVNHALRDFHHG